MAIWYSQDPQLFPAPEGRVEGWFNERQQANLTSLVDGFKYVPVPVLPLDSLLLLLCALSALGFRPNAVTFGVSVQVRAHHRRLHAAGVGGHVAAGLRPVALLVRRRPHRGAGLQLRPQRQRARRPRLHPRRGVLVLPGGVLGHVPGPVRHHRRLRVRPSSRPGRRPSLNLGFDLRFCAPGNHRVTLSQASRPMGLLVPHGSHGCVYCDVFMWPRSHVQKMTRAGLSPCSGSRSGSSLPNARQGRRRAGRVGRECQMTLTLP